MMYARFPLSLRNVEDLLHKRGVKVSHEALHLEGRLSWHRQKIFEIIRLRGIPVGT